MRKPVCDLGDLPSVTFKGNSATISKDAEAVLATVAEKMRNSPACKVVVTGYGEPSKSSQQLSWDRVNACYQPLWLTNKGISSDRFIFRFGETGGDATTVDYQGCYRKRCRTKYCSCSTP
jgi:outer membrane protein OmpA-like peptidoglycan-associated protein